MGVITMRNKQIRCNKNSIMLHVCDNQIDKLINKLKLWQDVFSLAVWNLSLNSTNKSIEYTLHAHVMKWVNLFNSQTIKQFVPSNELSEEQYTISHVYKPLPHYTYRMGNVLFCTRFTT